MENINRVGIKPSKKYALGSIHENGTGQFEILDRYLEDNVIMLKFKWLTGEFSGEVDTNKETNVNASIWKFKNVRGLTTVKKQSSTEINETLSELVTVITSLTTDISEMKETISRQELMIEELRRQSDIVSKLIEKI